MGTDQLRSPEFWRGYFDTLADSFAEGMRSDEGYALSLSGESSTFVRFNQSRVRQAGEVLQARLTLQLFQGASHGKYQLNLSGGLSADLASLNTARSALRERLPALPADPLLQRAPPSSTAQVMEAERVHRPSTTEQAEALLDLTHDLDAVGLVSDGVLWRGFRRDQGETCWFASDRFDLDWSLYAQADKAIKQRYAGRLYDPSALRERVAEGRRTLPLLTRPEKRLTPGEYRAFLSPAALNELFSFLTWGAFSKRALAQQSSALARFARGEASFSSSLTLEEAPERLGAPLFQSAGFQLPAQLPLIQGGKLVGSMVGPRSAAEYQQPVTSSEEEVPQALSLSAGELPLTEAAEALGEGAWLSDLWYLNYSDQAAGRITGMSRFASLWVEGGEPVAPLSVMRFDDTLERTLGTELEALTRERTLFPSRSSYGERSLESAQFPGALLRGLRFTL